MADNPGESHIRHNKAIAMMTAPIPLTEPDRLQALRALSVLDTDPEAEFDALVNAASAVCDMPVSLVSLVDADRQWFKANRGLEGATETPRDVAFCAHAILQDGILEVPDARLDARFADNPLVVGAPDIRFYAGAPVRLSDGHCVGTLCVIDRQPRHLNDRQREVLRCLARATAQALEGRRALQTVRQMVNDLSQAAQESEHRASHDALTGLLNRAAFEAQVTLALERARLDPTQASSLMCIDLDNFKIVNDTCGHAAGDQLLKTVAKMLRGAVRHSDVLARLGGDEFALLLPACPDAAAQAVGRKICAQFADFRYVHGTHRMVVGASIGLALIDERWDTPAAVMQAADASCYAAKQTGRNRVVCYSDDEAAIVQRAGQTHWARRIEQALDTDGFVLHGQRIVPLHTRGLQVKLELLLRMVDTDGSLIPPAAFIPSAERYHLMGRVDRWVLQKAVAWLHDLLRRGEAPPVAVNLSGQSISDRGFHRWALDLLAAAGPAVRERLILEVTETSVVTNLTDAASFMGEARALGVKTALDDFGVGSSSFGYLKTLPIDYLKIDGQFVRNVLTDPLDAAAVRCFVDVARVVGLKTVAEFVESEAVQRHLAELGVDLVQGFHLHRPGPLPTAWPQV
jgi:diguanylate cyclase (GGDEF)-like protein